MREFNEVTILTSIIMIINCFNRKSTHISRQKEDYPSHKRLPKQCVARIAKCLLNKTVNEIITIIELRFHSKIKSFYFSCANGFM